MARPARHKGSAPAEGKTPSMPHGHEHADPGSQLPLTPFLTPSALESVADAKLEQRAAVNYHSPVTTQWALGLTTVVSDKSL